MKMLLICVFFCIIGFATETNVAPITVINLTQSVWANNFTEKFTSSPTMSTNTKETIHIISLEPIRFQLNPESVDTATKVKSKKYNSGCLSPWPGKIQATHHWYPARHRLLEHETNEKLIIKSSIIQ